MDSVEDDSGAITGFYEGDVYPWPRGTIRINIVTAVYHIWYSD